MQAQAMQIGRMWVGSVALLALLGASGCGPSKEESRRQVTAALEDWIKAMNEHDYETAYSYMSASTRVLLPKDEFIATREKGKTPATIAFVRQIRHELTSVELTGEKRALAKVSFTMPNPSVLMPMMGGGGDTEGDVTLNRDFELIQEPDGWKIIYSEQEVQFEQIMAGNQN